MSEAWDGGVASARMANDAAATRADTAATRMALRMNPPALQESGRNRMQSDRDCLRIRVFREAKNVSVRVRLDGHAVVHLVHPQDLRVAAIAAQFVILAHDQRLDRLGRTDLGAESAETAPRKVEVEIVEDFNLLSRLAMATERNQVVGARFRALVADDAGLGAGAGLGLEPQHAAEAGRSRAALRRILKGERRLRGVLQRDPQPLEEVDEKNPLQEFEDHDRSPPRDRASPTRMGSLVFAMMTRSLRSTVPSLRILSCSRISP